MQSSELEKLCKMKTLTVPKASSLSTDEERCEAYLELLMMDLGEQAYHSIGIPVKRLGSLSAAAQLAQHHHDLERMDRDALTVECSVLDLPLLESTTREEMISWLKDIVIWMKLPAVELH